MTDFTDIANEVAASNRIEAVGVPTVPGRRVHIDGDMLAYQCGGNDETDVATSRRILKSKIDLFKEASGAESILLHMTASGSTKGDRAVIAYTKPYQGQRKGHRPKNWQYLRDYMADGVAGPIKQWYDREADDGFGFISAQCHGDVIATRDKDMRMLPGLHLNWDTYELAEVKPDVFGVEHGGKMYGHRWFWTQMLWGDAADNIPGLPKHPDFPRGVGEVAAGKLLAFAHDDDSAAQAVAQAYKAYWGDEWADRYAEQASLLWIRRTQQAPIHEWSQFLPVGPQLTAAVERMLTRVNLLKEEAACLSD